VVKIIETANVDLDALTASEQYNLYNGADCCITFEVFEKLQGKLNEAEPAYRNARALQGPAWTLMQRGIRIDTFARDEVLAELRADHHLMMMRFISLCDKGWGKPAINYRSPTQLKHLFYEVIGLPAVKTFNKTTKEYDLSSGREALEKLQSDWRAKHLVDLILGCRDIDKKVQVLTTETENNRMHCSYQVAGTLSGRWSSNESAFGGGQNLQNISDEMRRVFVADEGMKLCQLDLQQAESKLVAYLALPWGDNYLKATQSGDLHTYVVKLIWSDMFKNTNESDKDIAKRRFYRDYSFRDMGKRGGHLSNYAGQPTVAAMHLKIPLKFAQEFNNTYFKSFPEIAQWHNNVKVKLANGEPITTPLGRRCHFPGRSWDNDTIKSAISYAPQSTIGDVLNLGMYNVWKKYDKIWNKANPIEILLQVHDAIVFQYHPSDESWLIPEIMKALEYPVEINGQTCVVRVDPQVAWN